MSDQPAELFNPARLPARDEYGFTYHPDVDRFMVGFDGGEWQDGDEGRVDPDALRAAGWESRCVSMEDQTDADEFDAWMERGLSWQVQTAGTLALSIALAAASYHWVEARFRV